MTYFAMTPHHFGCSAATLVEVVGLATLDGSLSDPSAEPWFHLVIRLDDANYDVITKDGTSFRYLYPSYHDYRGDWEGLFSSDNKFVIEKAIKRYVDKVTI